MSSPALLPHKTQVIRQGTIAKTCQPFYSGFRIIGRFHRLVGCSFLENLPAADYESVRAKRASLYLLYQLFIWSFLLLVGLSMYVESQQSNSKMTDAAQLNKSIYLTFCTAVYVEAALNSVLLLLRAPTFVEILRMLCGLLVEADFGVPPRLQRQMQRFAWKVVAFQAAIAFLNVVLHIYSDFGTALLVDDWRQLEPFFKNVAISHAFLGVPFLSFMCVSTRLWFMYISQAVALCVACIHRSLGCCLRSRSTPNRRKALLVDRMRVQLGLLGSCVKLASWLLGPSLLYAYAYSVPILCAAAYYTIVPELKFRIRLFFLFFWMLHWLSILLPVITAQRMKRAIMELRGAIQQASMTTYSEELLAQLRMMLNWSKHNDLQFTGSGFFVVDVSTFTQMMGAVITYTVVLVQTSNSYQRGSLQQCTKRIVD